MILYSAVVFFFFFLVRGETAAPGSQRDVMVPWDSLAE